MRARNWLLFGLVIVLAGCGSKPPPPACPPGATPEAAYQPQVPPRVEPMPPVTPPFEDDTVIARSRQVMAAFDGRDDAGFQQHLGATFGLYQRGRTATKEQLAGSMKARTDLGAPIRTRTCTDERIVRGPTHVIYLGTCIEQLPAWQDLPAGTLEGVNTLVWLVEDGAFKVAWWAWEKGGIEAEASMWDDVYRTGTNFRRQPNRHLVSAVQSRKPGKALDIAMGQGRNAIYLAEQGWQVTGVDISKEGIRIAQATAAAKKVKLNAVEANVDTWDLGKAKWDLVTLIYAGAEEALITRAQASIKKGGLFVVEFFHADAMPGSGISSFKDGQLAAAFAKGWKIITDEVVEDTADWSLRKVKLVRFTAQKL